MCNEGIETTWGTGSWGRELFGLDTFEEGDDDEFAELAGEAVDDGDAEHIVEDIVMGSESDSDSSSSSGSSSSSNSDAVPPLPAVGPIVEAVAAPPPPGGGRSKADAEVVVPNGFLRYYNTNRKFMVAHCEHHREACRLTRALNESKARNRAGQGRPLGLLLAWLAAGHDYDSAWSHVHCEMPGLAARVLHRENNRDTPGVSFLMEHAERPTRDDEGEELEVLP